MECDHTNGTLPRRSSIGFIAKNQGEAVVPIGEQTWLVRVDIAGVFTVDKDLPPGARAIVNDDVLKRGLEKLVAILCGERSVLIAGGAAMKHFIALQGLAQCQIASSGRAGVGDRSEERRVGKERRS